MTPDQQRLSETYDLLLAHLELWQTRLIAAHLIPENIRTRLLQEKEHLLAAEFSQDTPFQEWAAHIGRHRSLTAELLHVLSRAELFEQDSVNRILAHPAIPQAAAQSIPPPVPGYQPGSSSSAWSSSSYFTSSSWWSS